ncbi:MAG: alpha/beta fold hydrolase [Thermodesulfobacteriota bacterium]
MEEDVTIPGPGITLEGRFRRGAAKGGAVIAHPHPLFGGSMDNNVVWTMMLAFRAQRWSTLRFNFRGVGRSTGSHGQGLAEVEDLGAALAFLEARSSGPYYLAGYSFGAAVVARALLQGLKADGALLISPPIAFMDLGFLPLVPHLSLIIAGDQDELCPRADLEALLTARPTPVPVKVIAGTDHFFAGREEALFNAVRDYLLSKNPA